LLEIRGSGSSRALASLRQIEQESFELLGRGPDEVLVSSSGKEIAVDQDAARGYVDVVDPDAGIVQGWTTDPAGGRPADRVVAFEGDRFLVTGQPALTRPDLESVGPGATQSGFRLNVAGEDFDFEETELRVFAVIGDRASELPRAGS
jgi:hypothetical protein